MLNNTNNKNNNKANNIIKITLSSTRESKTVINNIPTPVRPPKNVQPEIY